MSSLRDVLGFRRRKRTRSHRTVTSNLFRSHTFLAASNPIVTGTAFPTRTGDVTFAIEVSIDGPSPNGLVLELGDTTTGLAIWLDGPDVHFSAGDAGNNGVSVVAAGAMPSPGNYRIAVAIRAGSGEARLWVDGRLHGRGTAVNGLLPHGWSSSGNGAVGDKSGTVSSRVPVGQAVALTDASIVGRLSGFIRQVPRHFSESVYS